MLHFLTWPHWLLLKSLYILFAGVLYFPFFFLTCHAVDIQIAIPSIKSSIYEESEVMIEALKAFFKQSQVDVSVTFKLIEKDTPSDFYDWLDKFQLSTEREPEFDIFLLDPTVITRKVEQFRPLDQKFDTIKLLDFLSSPLRYGILLDKLYAIPVFLNYGMLFYRDDLLKKYNFSVPKKWPDLERVAKHILNEEKNEKLVGFVSQFTASEYLVGNFFEWMGLFDKGRAIDMDTKTVNLDNENTTLILNMFRNWTGTNMLPKDFIKFGARQSADKFFNGEAIFMRHLNTAPLYERSLEKNSDPISWKVTLPPGYFTNLGRSAMFGWYGVVPQHLRPQIKEMDVLKVLNVLTHFDFQKYMLDKLNFIPAVYHLEDCEEICHNKVIPCYLFKKVKRALRPLNAFNKNYFYVSEEIQKQVQLILQKQISASEGLLSLQANLGDYLKIPTGAPRRFDTEKFIHIEAGFGLIIGIITWALLCINMVVLIHVLFYKNHPIFKKSMISFLLIILFGTSLTYCSVFFLMGKMSEYKCHYQMWAFNLSFTLSILPLIVKNFAMHRIFNHTSQKIRILGYHVNKKNLMFCVVVAVVVEMVLLSIWSMSSSISTDNIHVEPYYHVVCLHSSHSVPKIIFSILVGYKIIMLMYGMHLVYCIRDIHSDYNESRDIGVVIYVIVYFGLIIFPIVLGKEKHCLELDFITRSIYVLACGGTVTFWVFLPKLLHLYKPRILSSFQATQKKPSAPSLDPDLAIDDNDSPHVSPNPSPSTTHFPRRFHSLSSPPLTLSEKQQRQEALMPIGFSLSPTSTILPQPNQGCSQVPVTEFKEFKD